MRDDKRRRLDVIGVRISSFSGCTLIREAVGDSMASLSSLLSPVELIDLMEERSF